MRKLYWAKRRMVWIITRVVYCGMALSCLYGRNVEERERITDCCVDVCTKMCNLIMYVLEEGGRSPSAVFLYGRIREAM